jgi:hypothetical protein
VRATVRAFLKAMAGLTGQVWQLCKTTLAKRLPPVLGRLLALSLIERTGA